MKLFMPICSLLLLTIIAVSCNQSGKKAPPVPSQEDSVYITRLFDSVKWYKRSNLILAKQYTDSALQFCTNAGYDVLKITGLIHAGSIELNSGNIDSAYYYLNQAAELSVLTKDSLQLARSYGHIGNLFYSSLDPHSAKIYYLKAMDIFIALADSFRIAQSYESIGNTFMDISANDSATFYYQKALNYYTQKEDMYGVYRSKQALATLAFYENNLEKASFLLAQADSIQQFTGYQDIELHIKRLLLEVQLNIEYHKTHLNLPLLQKADSLMRENEIYDLEWYISITYAKHFKSIKQFEKSVEYFEKSDKIRESLVSLETRTKLARLNANVSTYVKQQELDIAQKNNELNELRFDQQNTILVFLLIVLLLLSVIIYITIQRNKQIKQNLHILTREKAAYGNIFNLLKDGIAIYNKEHLIVEVNPALCRMTGKTPENLLYKKIPEQIQAVISSEKEEPGTLRIENENEEINTYYVTQTEISYLGEPCMLVLLSDVTNIVKLAEKQREIEQYEFIKKISELKIWALRSQINPHFIFNSLNSIQYLIFNNLNEEAVNYLTKFSKLIRSVFETSDQKGISVSQELKQLELYIEIEQLRFADGFECSIKHKGFTENELNSILIPPMILQPYVENALWHGLNHKKEKKTLEIELNKTGKIISCTIKDNGIGRKASALMKAERINYHQSAGMSKTAQRIELINQADGTHSYVTVKDLYDQQGNSAGTEVLVIFELN